MESILYYRSVFWIYDGSGAGYINAPGTRRETENRKEISDGIHGMEMEPLCNFHGIVGEQSSLLASPSELVSYGWLGILRTELASRNDWGI